MKNEYRYCLYVWGGFFNDEFAKIHKEQQGKKFFKNKEDRDAYLSKLRAIEIQLNAKHLVFDIGEGYETEIPWVLHRISEYQWRQYYTRHIVDHPSWDIETAQYHLENKWYPGCNDYPLGHDHDYENDPVNEV